MQSHSYNYKPRQLAGLILPILLIAGVFAALPHLGAKLNLLPKPRPTLDMERTILIHQADAARSTKAPVILIGDSSCLMNVSAPIISERLGATTLNVGTFSYLGLADYATLIRERHGAFPDQQDTIVLLMHPESLRRSTSDPYYRRILENYLSGTDDCETFNFYGRLSCGLGLDIVRGRVFARLLPHPLSSRFADSYGFTSSLDHYLTAQWGSLIDVEPKPFSGNAEYRLVESLEARSRAFRQSLPRSAKLLVGITPVPETFAPQGYAEQYQQMLKTWSEWLQADAVLTNLPPTLPDRLFAKVTHLNSEGVPLYSQKLAQSLTAATKGAF